MTDSSNSARSSRRGYSKRSSSPDSSSIESVHVSFAPQKKIAKKKPRFMTSTPKKNPSRVPSSYHMCRSILYGPFNPPRMLSPKKIENSMRIETGVKVETRTNFFIENDHLVVDWQVLVKPKTISPSELSDLISQLKEAKTFVEEFSHNGKVTELMESSLLLSERILFFHSRTSIDFSGQKGFFISHPMQDICPIKWSDGEEGHLNAEEIYASNRTETTISKREALVLSFGKMPSYAEELRNSIKMSGESKVPTGGETTHFEESCIVKGKALILSRDMALKKDSLTRLLNKENEKEYLLEFSDEQSTQKVSDTVSVSPTPTMLTFPKSIALSAKEDLPPVELSKSKTKRDSTRLEKQLTTKKSRESSRRQTKKYESSQKQTPRTKASRKERAEKSKRERALRTISDPFLACKPPSATKETALPVAKQRILERRKIMEEEVPIVQLKTVPEEFLTINAPFDQPHIYSLELKNEGKRHVAWAVKTNRKDIFNSTPTCGVLNPAKDVKLALTFQGMTMEPKDGDRLTVQYVDVEPGVTFNYDLFFKDNITVVKKVVHIHYNN